MQVVGLTGSIASGKSYIARRFARLGVPVFDSDAAVHRLFAPPSRLPARIEAGFPGVVDAQGLVDRRALGAVVFNDPEALERLENMVHPAVAEAQREFLGEAARRRMPRVVLDIPLLFEGGRRQRFDAVVVVACSPRLQRARALARPGMTSQRLATILAKQMPVAEKRRLADRVIESGHDRGRAHDEVLRTLDWLDRMPHHAWPSGWN